MQQSDKAILRELARKQLEIANSPGNLETVAQWRRHAARRPGRPMVHIEIDTFQQEIIAPMLRCQDPDARSLEYRLYHAFTNRELFGDDKPVAPYFQVGWQGYFRLFGYEITRTEAVDAKGGTLGHQFNYVIGELEEDYHKLGPSEFGVNAAASKAHLAAAEDAIGDILPVKMGMNCLYAVPTQQIVHMMGMENMYVAMLDCPELFLQMMDRVADDYIAWYKLMELEGYLLPTTGFEGLGQGTWCFTDELSGTETPTTREVWGFMDSQETVSISPEMFGELIFPCYKKIADQFGLLSYGCCEPVHPVWELVKTFPGLRKVSISPWCDEVYMGERLRGSDVIFHRKPSPNYLGVGETLDENAFREHITATMRAAKGCTLEITQRDVYTVHNNPGKVRRYVELIRQCAEREWQP